VKLLNKNKIVILKIKNKMAKRESSFINMLVTLFAVSLIASISLAAVYNVTKEPIAKSKALKKEKAISNVLPEFDRIETFKVFPSTGKDSIEFNMAFKGEDTVGIAIETYTDNGFGGRIKAMVGIKHDGTVYDVFHLEHTETPGLGDKVDKSKSTWSDQFKGKISDNFPLIVKKDGGNVDAITAATITSRAYCDAINRAYETYKKWRE